MKAFDDLGTLVREEWRRADFDTQALPDIATAALRATPLVERFRLDTFVAWVASATALPAQGDLASTFGQPPLTVYWDPRFFIQVLFWTTATTAIHQHGFSGAFLVLEGSSLQSEYRFDVEHRVNAHMLIGNLRLERCAVLTRGDVQPIHAGNALIHSVFHLDTPSVTVVVRSHHDEESGVQYEYLRPHLAVDSFFTDPVMTRRLQMLDLLDRLASPRCAVTAARMLDRADCLETYELLRQARRHRHGAAAFNRLLGRARARHGGRIDRLVPVIEEAERESALIALRERVVNRDHRVLLALLINLQDRESILAAIKSIYPRDDSQRLVLRWLGELSGTLGVEMDALNRSLLRHQLSGLNFETVCERLGDEYSPEEVAAQRAQLREHCERLRTHAALRPLLMRSEESQQPAFGFRPGRHTSC